MKITDLCYTTTFFISQKTQKLYNSTTLYYCCSTLVNNNPKVSPGGKNLSKWIVENNLELVNVWDQTHTHIDRSSKTGDTNILDLAITNSSSIIQSFKVDNKVERTPYRVRHTKTGIKKSHTDHLTLSLEVSIEWCKKPTTNKHAILVLVRLKIHKTRFEISF